jgi:periplasmic glucans biosynthesis protein
MLKSTSILPTMGLLRPASAFAAPDASTNSFSATTVRNLARQLAQQPFKAPDSSLPAELKNLDYQAYRAIRFDPSQALWHDLKLKFTAEFFSRGFLYKDRIDVYEVVNGQATQIPCRPQLFTSKVKLPTNDVGFAGFRLHYPLNRSDYFDEICAFLGASYFRAVAKGQGYGLSARGLAIKTADPSGEEFPLFKTFWLERPSPGADSIVVHALLDSQSATGAFRFTIRPGADTIFDTEVALYPRIDITTVGIAPLTSMFMFDTNDRFDHDDWRNAVHDSDVLALFTGQRDHILRPIANRRELQISAFDDLGPRGFGLLQRKRKFDDYQDAEARYEKRPSLWVESIGDWNKGIVELVEIPSPKEVNDNVVAFWRPKDPLKAKSEYLVEYRLHWCWTHPIHSPLGKVVATRCGQAWDHNHRQFVIDFVGEALNQKTAEAPPAVDSGSSKGKIVSAVAKYLPDIQGWRLSLELDPQSNKLVELHARLMDGDKPLTENWMYRWTSA